MLHLLDGEFLYSLANFRPFFFSLLCLGFCAFEDSSAKAEKVTYKLLNGDLISGQLIIEESNEKVKVLMHPQLGRIEINTLAIVPTIKEDRWKNHLEAGLDGSTTGANDAESYSLTFLTNYKDNLNELEFRSSYDFEQSAKAEGDKVIGANKLLGELRFDRGLGRSWSAYLFKAYKYNALNNIGTNNIESSFGFAYKLFDKPKFKLRVSAGPSLNWIGGGNECSSDSDCGDINPGSSFGSQLKWSLNDYFILNIANKYGIKYASETFSSNSFSTSLKFYPRSGSSLYTSLRYENLYDEIKEPSQEHIYRFLLGTSF